jgi:heme/copper-type cytochrome/quinol oxidase subunit 2
MTILLIYWILTTIYGVYWLVKHPSERHGDDMEHFTVMEVLGHIFPSMILAPFFVPMMLLNKIEFKR